MANYNDPIPTVESAARVCADQERKARRAAGRGEIQAADAAASVAERAAQVARNAVTIAGPRWQQPYGDQVAYRAERLAAQARAHARLARTLAAGAA